MINNKLVRKFKVIILPVVFCIIVSLVLAIGVFIALLTAKYVGFYDDILALGLYISFILGIAFASGFVKIN